MSEIIKLLAELIAEVNRVDYLFAGLLILLTTLIIILETLSKKAKAKQAEAGLKPEIRSVVSHKIDSKISREYISSTQGLAGRPDAVIIENGFHIPVERKPFSNKIRDRYIAQLLVYMRLIEEFEGKKPPYGYLILGSNSRRITVLNTEARQTWLSKILDDMHKIIDEQKLPEATPQRRKCNKCKVAAYCTKKTL